MIIDYSNLIIAFGLSAIVPINMWLQGYYSNCSHRFDLFKNHFACHNLDWLFVFFNFFWIYSITCNLSFYIFAFAFSFVISSVSHYSLVNMPLKYWDNNHLIDRKNRKILPAGFVHFGFSTIETAMLIIFVLSTVNSIGAHIASGVMLVFFSFVLYGSKKIHGKIVPYDWIFFGVGITTIIVKIVFLWI